MSDLPTMSWSAEVGDHHTFELDTKALAKARKERLHRRQSAVPAATETRPFDLVACIARWRKSRYDAVTGLTFAKLSDDEIRFWLFANFDHRYDEDEVEADLRSRDFSAPLTWTEVCDRVRDFDLHGGSWQGDVGAFPGLALRFFGWGDVFMFVLEDINYGRSECIERFPPCADPQEMARIAPDVDRWMADNIESETQEAGEVLRFYPSSDYAQRYFEHIRRWWVTDRPSDLLVQLDDGPSAYQLVRKRKLAIPPPDAVALIERFGYDGIEDLVFALEPADAVHVRAAAAVPVWLTRCAKPTTAALAEHWLLHEGANAIAGMLEALARRGKKRDTAVRLLRRLAETHEDLIVALAENAPDKAHKALQSDVLAAQTHRVPELPREQWPGWMATAAAAQLHDKVERLLGSSRLETVYTEDLRHRVPEAALLGVLSGCAASGANRVSLTGVDRASSGRMIWELAQRWIGSGLPKGGKFVLSALAVFGGPAEAAKLGRAARGVRWDHMGTTVKTLRAIGGRDGLTALRRLAEKEATARSALAGVREARGYDKDHDEDFDDAIIPTCGLSDLHTIDLDFGSRIFTLALVPPSKIVIVDRDSGEIFQKWPPRRKKDDPDKYKAAQEVYKLFKKDLADVVEHETHRFEQAMLNARLWKRQDWLSHISLHPVMGPLACTIVWKTWHGDQLRTFIPTHPDDTCIDTIYDEVALGDQIGILHPAECSPQLRAAWATLLTDSEIVQPFAQLGRACFAPGEPEAKALMERLTTHKWTDDELRRRALWKCHLTGITKKQKYAAFERTWGDWKLVMTLDEPIDTWSWPPSDPDYGIESVVFRNTSKKGNPEGEPPAPIHSEALLALQKMFQ